MKTKQKAPKVTNTIISILNTLLPTIILLYSCSILLVKTFRYFKTNKHHPIATTTTEYEPLNKFHSKRFYYGATTSTALEEDVDDDQSSSETMVSSSSPHTNKYPLSMYDLSRVLMSVGQVGLIIYTVWSLVPSSIDEQVEGQYADVIRMYYARAAFWVRIVMG